jgi:hypothetical protein
MVNTTTKAKTACCDRRWHKKSAAGDEADGAKRMTMTTMMSGQPQGPSRKGRVTGKELAQGSSENRRSLQKELAL